MVYISWGGGRQDRDIEAFMKVAAKMPDLKFKAIFLKEQIPQGMNIPSNVDLRTNTDRNTFYEIMGNAEIMLMPLKAYSPCGLQVVQKAMLMGQNIIGTDTPSMRILIPSKEYGILTPMGDVDSMVSAIRYIIANPTEATTMKENSHKRCEDLFSPQQVAKQIIRAIEMTMQLNNNQSK